MLKEFKQFLLRGNVIDLAVGVVIGTAFGTVVTALVTDFITPLIAAIIQIPNFNNFVFTINRSRFMLGHFTNTLLAFILISAVIFFLIIKPTNMLIARNKKKSATDDSATKKCKECLSEIPLHAKRCSHCTQVVV